MAQWIAPELPDAAGHYQDIEMVLRTAADPFKCNHPHNTGQTTNKLAQQIKLTGLNSISSTIVIQQTWECEALGTIVLSTKCR